MTSELVSQMDCPLTVYMDRGVWSFDEKHFPSEFLGKLTPCKFVFW